MVPREKLSLPGEFWCVWDSFNDPDQKQVMLAIGAPIAEKVAGTVSVADAAEVRVANLTNLPSWESPASASDALPQAVEVVGPHLEHVAPPLDVGRPVVGAPEGAGARASATSLLRRFTADRLLGPTVRLHWRPAKNGGFIQVGYD